MSDGIMLSIGEDGIAREYDDTYDITIHCESREEQAEAIKALGSKLLWIPCSERLPEKSGRYLVTNTRLGAFEVTWNIFYNGKGEAPDGWLYEDGTIAWMPLPEPYKGEERQ